MSRAFRLALVALALATGNAAAKKQKGPPPPPPAPASVETSWYFAPRPAGEGWLAVDRNGDDVILVRDGSGEAGAGPEDSWSAQVLVMPPLSDGTSTGLRTFLEREYRDRLLTSGRFELLQWKADPDATGRRACATASPPSIARHT